MTLPIMEFLRRFPQHVLQTELLCMDARMPRAQGCARAAPARAWRFKPQHQTPLSPHARTCRASEPRTEAFPYIDTSPDLGLLEHRIETTLQAAVTEHLGFGFISSILQHHPLRAR